LTPRIAVGVVSAAAVPSTSTRAPGGSDATMIAPPVAAAAAGAAAAGRVCVLRHDHAPAVSATPTANASATGSGERPIGSRTLEVSPSPAAARRFSTAPLSARASSCIEP